MTHIHDQSGVQSALPVRSLRAASESPALPEAAAFRASDSRGFSLLELIIVILVMSLVAAVSYPALSRGTASFHLRATGRDVLNTLRLAREKAISEQRGMRVVVNRETQRIVMADDVGEGQRIYSLPHDVRIALIKQPGQDTKEGILSIRFRPNGSSETGEIILRSDTGAMLRVITDPITGGARIEAGPGDGTP